MPEPVLTVRKPSGSRPVVTRIRAGTKYSPAFCDDLVVFAEKGFSVIGFCGSIGISEKTFYNWLGEYPEFAEAHEVAKAVRVFGSENRLIDACTSLEFNKALALLRAHGAKVWAPHDYQSKPWEFGNDLLW